MWKHVIEEGLAMGVDLRTNCKILDTHLMGVLLFSFIDGHVPMYTERHAAQNELL